MKKYPALKPSLLQSIQPFLAMLQNSDTMYVYLAISVAFLARFLLKNFFFLNVSDTFYLEPPGKPITSSILWRLFFSPAQNELVSFLTDRYAWHIIYPSSGYEVTKISPLLLGHLILTITPSQHLLTGNSFHQLFIHLLSTVFVGIAYILHIYM